MPKVEVTVSTDKIGSEVQKVFDIDNEDWKDMQSWEKDEMMLGLLLEHGMINWDYMVVPCLRLK